MTPPEERLESLDLLGQRLAEAAASDIPAARRVPALRIAIPTLLVAAITGLAFTAPGRAVTSDLAGLIGIGEVGGEPTQPSEVGNFDSASEQIVLAEGTTANRDPFEIVAFRSDEPVSPGSDTICVNVEFPERPPGSYGRSCYAGALNYGGLCCSGVTTKHDPTFVPEAQGEVRPGISRVEITYFTEEAERRTVEAEIGMITPDFAERLDVDHPSGRFFASLPGLATTTREFDPPGPADEIDVSAFDAQGTLVERETIRPVGEGDGELQERRLLFERYVACAKEHGASDSRCEAIRNEVSD